MVQSQLLKVKLNLRIEGNTKTKLSVRIYLNTSGKRAFDASHQGQGQIRSRRLSVTHRMHFSICLASGTVWFHYNLPLWTWILNKPLTWYCWLLLQIVRLCQLFLVYRHKQLPFGLCNHSFKVHGVKSCKINLLRCDWWKLSQVILNIWK